MQRQSRLMSLAAFSLTTLLLASSWSATQAGWDNVFQVACWDCRSKPRSSYYAAPSSQPRTSYTETRPEQRCYYEPVTVMRPERYVEEVPVKVKSYYYEPVTSYTYSSYYDDCTGRCQKIAVPRTSYVRKEECNTVMKYVERVRMVPTQVQRKVCETRQVVTYYGPITKTYECDSCELPNASGASPRVDVVPGNAPNVNPSFDTIAPQQMPVQKNSFPRLFPGLNRSESQRPATPAPAPIKVNAQTTSRTPTLIRGEVVGGDQLTPKPGTKVVFMNANNYDQREYATADAFGHFDLKVLPGDWFVYLGQGDGKAQFYKKVSVANADAAEFKLVSR